MIVTPEFLDEFRKDFDEAVEALREKYDISINLGSITYEQERFSVTLSVNMTLDPEDIACSNFDAEAYKFRDPGITPGMYKRIFIGTYGKKYAVVALKPRSWKTPLRIVDVEDGESCKAYRDFGKNGRIHIMLKCSIPKISMIDGRISEGLSGFFIPNPLQKM